MLDEEGGTLMGPRLCISSSYVYLCMSSMHLCNLRRHAFLPMERRISDLAAKAGME